MTENQVKMKRVATLFAILLAIGIVISAGSVLVNVFKSMFIGRSSGDVMGYSIDIGSEISSISFDVDTAEVIIEYGNAFDLETNLTDNKLQVDVDNGVLNINYKEKEKLFSFKSNFTDSPYINLIVPNDFIAQDTNIEVGVGDIYLNNLKSENLYVSTGLGNISGYDVYSDLAGLNTGTGDIRMEQVDFTDLNVNSGLGDVKIEGSFAGYTQVDAGTGDIDIVVKGKREDYQLVLDAGIGSIKINGEELKSEYRSNDNLDDGFYVDSGLGDITLSFQ